MWKPTRKKEITTISHEPLQFLSGRLEERGSSPRAIGVFDLNRLSQNSDLFAIGTFFMLILYLTLKMNYYFLTKQRKSRGYWSKISVSKYVFQIFRYVESSPFGKIVFLEKNLYVRVELTTLRSHRKKSYLTKIVPIVRTTCKCFEMTNMIRIISDYFF